MRLPDLLWQQAQSHEQLLQLARDYIRKNYPDYTLKLIYDRFAVCEIKSLEVSE